MLKLLISRCARCSKTGAHSDHFLLHINTRREAASIKGSRYALVKNPEDLTDGQRARLEALKKRAGSRLVRAWELKEDLRAVFRAADGGTVKILAHFPTAP